MDARLHALIAVVWIGELVNGQALWQGQDV